MKKQPIIAVVGPTASGKTATGVLLAKMYNGEVVSADSMQIYKDMSISTAKPTAEEMQGIPHHLVGFAEHDKAFSVADYVMLAREVITEISSRGKLPIIVGGTGLYVDSLLENVKFDDTCSSTEIRQKLYKEAEEFGNHALWLRLNEIDPETASNVHENNLSRVVRAIEVYEMTGEKLSEHKINSRAEESPFDVCYIGLTYDDRSILYDRINKRVDKMLVEGLVEEAREFFNCEGHATSAQAIGIKELFPYINGEDTLDNCIEKIKLETRHYAKRQLTWFRRNQNINWIALDSIDLLNFNEQMANILKTIIANSNVLCYNKN